MSALYDMGILNDRVDLDSFEADFSDLAERVYSSNMGNIDADRLQREMMDIAYLDDIPACSNDTWTLSCPRAMLQ